MDIGLLIKNKREELNLTMKELAIRVGVNEGTISRWESGNIANMRRDKIYKLSKALDLSICSLMEWDEPKETPTTSPQLRTDEEQLLSKYNKMDDIDKGKLQERADVMLEADKYVQREKNAV